MLRTTAEDQVFSETQASLFGEVEAELLAKLREPVKLPRVESIFFCSWKIA
jgi:hypothetical protein